MNKENKINNIEFRPAIYPGSFDPFTLGHFDVLLRASKLFDKVYIAVAINIEKSPTFSLEERKSMIDKAVLSHECFSNVEVILFDGLITNFMKEHNIKILVRGIRDIDDLRYESRMLRMNKMLYNEMDTVLLHTNEAFAYISSSLIKEIVRFGGSLDGLIPQEIVADVEKKFLN